MDQAERERFHLLAEKFFAETGELVEILRHETARMKLAEEEIRARLDAGLSAAGTREAREAVERALEAEEVARDGVARFVGEALERVESIRAAGFESYLSAPDPGSDPEEAAGLLVRMRADAFSLDIMKFYTAISLTLLVAAITHYIDMCEAFLGHAVGAHEWRRRSTEVMKKLLGAGADVAIGILLAPIAIPAAFVDSGIEAIRQLRATPKREAERWEALIAKGNDERAILIQKSTAIAQEEVPHLEQYARISLDAVEEESAQIRRPLQ